ncbi:MAG: CsgG/HfaB family protein [Thermodesulfobacteriota bacterium]
MLTAIFRNRVQYLFLLLILCLISPSLSVAQSSQPAVAIKKPTIGEGVPGSVVNDLNLTTLWTEMEASFRATRKFRVLSRNKDTLKAIREEQKFAESDLAKGDAAATGQFDNANYLILPTVQDFKFYRTHKALPNFDNKFKRSDSGLLEVSAQMVDTSTGQVMTTFDLKSAFNTNPKIVNDKSGKPNSVKFTSMAQEVAAKLADQFVDAVYPMKVVKRDRRGQVFINRGKDGGLKIGQVLEVFYAGEELIDPDTGESLGSSEEYVGKVKISRINPKITIGKVISEEDPENAPIATGDILRRPQQ